MLDKKVNITPNNNPKIMAKMSCFDNELLVSLLELLITSESMIIFAA
jgi:hypothetical protein